MNSDARQLLAAKLAERNEVNARADAIRAALMRLQEAAGAPGPIEAEIAALDAAEGDAYAVWARSGSGTPPAVDTEGREALTRRLAEAKASAEASRRATGPLTADLQAEAERTAGIEREISAAIAEIVLDQLEPALADLREATVKVANLRQTIGEGRDLALRIAESLNLTGNVELVSTFYRRLERLDANTFDVVAATPTPVGMRATWAAFMAALARDADAKLAA